MSKKEKLLLKLLTGNADANFDISELIFILNWLEFKKEILVEAIKYSGKKE